MFLSATYTGRVLKYITITLHFNKKYYTAAKSPEDRSDVKFLWDLKNINSRARKIRENFQFVYSSSTLCHI